MADEDLLPAIGDEAPSKKGSRAMSSHPKYIDMVVDAIKQLEEKKGASVIAIKQWIVQSYPEIDQARMKGLLKIAIKKGLETEVIVRPKKSEGMGTLTGRYKLGKPPKPVAKKPPKKKTAKKVAKSSAGKSRKQSDGDVFDYSGSNDDVDDDGEERPVKALSKTGKAGKTAKAAPRQRSSSATATPKPKASKSKAIRRSKSHSPAPSKLKAAVAKNKTAQAKKAKAANKRSTSKSPARKAASKSPAKKAAKSPGKKAAAPKQKAPGKKSAKAGQSPNQKAKKKSAKK